MRLYKEHLDELHAASPQYSVIQSFRHVIKQSVYLATIIPKQMRELEFIWLLLWCL